MELDIQNPQQQQETASIKLKGIHVQLWQKALQMQNMLYTTLRIYALENRWILNVLNMLQSCNN